GKLPVPQGGALRRCARDRDRGRRPRARLGGVRLPGGARGGRRAARHRPDAALLPRVGRPAGARPGRPHGAPRARTQGGPTLSVVPTSPEMASAGGGQTPGPRPVLRSALALGALGLLIVAAVGVDAFGIGWFADDFHFLDVARRVPVAQALTGQYGIYPWYRPLSRELFYEAIVACGPAAPMVAHALALVVLFASAWLLFSLSRRRIAGPAAAVAPALFVCCDYTKFLTAWPSGFQDLLAVLLTLAAVEAHARGWTIRSRLAIALAPFAKETGFLAFPLVLAWSRFCEGERRVQPWM